MGLILPLIGIVRGERNRHHKFSAPPVLVLLALLTLSTWNAHAATFPAGSASPTSFGSQAVGIAQAQTPVTFTFTTGGTLDATPLVLTSGSPNLDFTLGTGSSCTGSVSTGTCTVNVVFKPKAPGQRLGAVVLTAGGSTVTTALLYGTGTGAAVVFPASTTTTTLNNTFVNPFSVAVDPAGDIFVADSNGNKLYEILAVSGTLRNLTPTGTTAPRGIALDGAGNLYFGDNGAVKEILAVGGVIPASPNPSTVKTLSSAYSAARGIAVDALGDVFVADSNNGVTELKAVNGSVAANTTPTALGNGYSSPGGVAVDSAYNVYVADYNNHVVKKLVYSSGTYAAPVVLGTSLGQHAFPNAVALDAAGNIYVANAGDGNGTDDGSIVELLAGSYSQSTLGTGFTTVKGVALDGAGNVYVADVSTANTNTHAVKEITLTTAPSLSFASTAVGSTSTDSPKSVTLANVGNGALTFANPVSGSNPSLSAGFTYGGTSTCVPTTANSTAYKLASGASCTEVVSFTPVVTGSPVTGTLTSTDNNLGVAGSTQVVSLSGTATADAFTVTGVSPSTGSTAGGTSVTITGTGLSAATKVLFGTVAAASFTYSATTQQITATSPAESTGTVDVIVGNATDVSVPTTADQFTYSLPGYVFVANGGSGTVSSYSESDGSSASTPANGGGIGVAVDSGGNVWSITAAGTGVTEFAPSGMVTATYSSTGISGASAVAVDGAGSVWLAQGGSSNNVYELTNAGVAVSTTGFATAGGINTPASLSVDTAGSLWIANSGNNTVTEVIGVAAPVATPVVTQVINTTSGVRP